MYKNKDLKAKSQLLRDIRAIVSRYGDEFGLAMPLGALNRKFARRAKEYGGIRTLVDELERQNMIYVHILRSGALILSIEEIVSKKALRIVR